MPMMAITTSISMSVKPRPVLERVTGRPPSVEPSSIRRGADSIRGVVPRLRLLGPAHQLELAALDGPPNRRTLPDDADQAEPGARDLEEVLVEFGRLDPPAWAEARRRGGRGHGEVGGPGA